MPMSSTLFWKDKKIVPETSSILLVGIAPLAHVSQSLDKDHEMTKSDLLINSHPQRPDKDSALLKDMKGKQN